MAPLHRHVVEGRAFCMFNTDKYVLVTSAVGVLNTVSIIAIVERPTRKKRQNEQRVFN